MAMTEAAKRAVPKSQRGVPSKSGTGSYPLDTSKHRAEAVSLAAMHHGANSSFTNRIRSRARKVASNSVKLSSLRYAG